MGRQRPQRGRFFLEGNRSPRIPPGHDLLHERLIRCDILKVAMASDAEGLIEPGLEMAVRRFHVAIFLGLSHIDSMPFYAIVIEQGLVLLGELLVAREIVDRRGKAVAPHALRHAARQMNRVLKPR